MAFGETIRQARGAARCGASAISHLEIGAIFRAAIPFLIANLLALLAVTLVPEISLWLPSVLMD